MGQSLVTNYVHIVFSTKYRRPFVQPPFNEELYSYIGGICKQLECQPVRINGYSDHIHILCNLSRKIALMKLVEKIKSHSSKWFKTRDESLKHFYWQNGYAAFSVNPTNMDRLVQYIDNQFEHHNKRNFKREFRSLLMKHNIDFDESYVWD